MYSPNQAHSDDGNAAIAQPSTGDPKVGDPPQVRWQIEHVSLDGHTPRYSSFLAGPQSLPWKNDLYIKLMKSLFDERPEEDELDSKNLARWTWGNYFAMSYTWRDPTVCRTILLNEVEVSVTENLEAALQQASRKKSIQNMY
jgi:hypothetical protein